MKSIAQLVDTKTGNADFSRNQQVVADDVAAGKAVTPVGDKAANAGLVPGQPTLFESCSIDRPC